MFKRSCGALASSSSLLECLLYPGIPNILITHDVRKEKEHLEFPQRSPCTHRDKRSEI